MSAKVVNKMPSGDGAAAGKEKKKGGGFLKRAAKSKKGDVVTEEQLLKADFVTPDEVNRLDKATKGKYSMLIIANRN